MKIERAEQVMNPRIVGVRDTQRLATAARIMFRKGFSQLPVYRGDTISASISESLIFKWLESAEKIIDMAGLSIRRQHLRLNRAMPTVDVADPVQRVKELLRRNNALIVTSSSRPVGIVTKSDFLKFLMDERYVKTWE